MPDDDAKKRPMTYRMVLFVSVIVAGTAAFLSNIQTISSFYTSIITPRFTGIVCTAQSYYCNDFSTNDQFDDFLYQNTGNIVHVNVEIVHDIVTDPCIEGNTSVWIYNPLQTDNGNQIFLLRRRIHEQNGFLYCDTISDVSVPDENFLFVSYSRRYGSRYLLEGEFRVRTVFTASSPSMAHFTLIPAN